MSIVTRTGDNGETGLVGGKRIPKSDLRLHTYGTVDELNAMLGMILTGPEVTGNRRDQLQRLQHLLFRLGADLASPMDVTKTRRIEPTHVKEIEKWIDTLERVLPPLTAFILPGGSKAGSLLHFARTITRRAERWAVALSVSEPVNKEAIVFLNRLSDYLFLAARQVNRDAGMEETTVVY